MKRPRPFKIVREGSTVLPIHRLKTRTGTVYSVVWYDGSQRMRKAFAKPDAATEFAGKQAKALAQLGTATQALSGEELLAYRRARGLLAPFQVPIDTAVAEWVEARKALGAVSLATAAKEYATLRPAAVHSPPLAKVIDEFLAAKESAGRSERHLSDLTYRLKRFRDAFKVPVAGVKVPDVERWLSSLNVNGRTRTNYLTALTNLVRFAERRGYVAKGWIDLGAIERTREESEIEVFTPDELKKILKAARPELVPFLALCAFAGLRHAEAARLDWSEIGEHIDVKAAKSKTRARRLVPLLDPLPSWLAPHRKESGPVCPFVKIDNQITELVTESKVTWKRNGLRHAYGTYRMALVKNEAQVALEMGNTPAMVFRHYRAVATEETARAWFAVKAGPGRSPTSDPQAAEPSPASPSGPTLD